MSPKPIPKVKPDHWLLGSIKSYKEDPLGFLKKNVEIYGDIYQFRTAHKRINVLNRPEYVQYVLQKNQRNYKRHFAYTILKLLVGEGLLTTDGEKWKRKRRLMQPHFHKESIKSYFDIINEYTKQTIDQWNEKKEVWLLSEMTKLTLDIITSCFLGGSVPHGATIVENNLPFALETILSRIQNPLQLPLWVPTAKNKKFKKCVRKLDELVSEIIQKKADEPIGNDLITMYLLLERKGEQITKQQIFDEVITILSAGHETTAIAMYSLVRHVYENKEVRQKVKEEYDQITQGQPLTLAHLPQLNYVNNVINESLRLSTPVWTIGREIIADDEIDGYKLKKGESVLVSPYLIHRNKDFWSDPDTFNPNRFNEELAHKYAHFPFGGGPKLCIGMGLSLMEMQIILYHIIRSNYELEPSNNEEIAYEVSLTLRPKTDIRLVKFTEQPKSIPQPTN